MTAAEELSSSPVTSILKGGPHGAALFSLPILYLTSIPSLAYALSVCYRP